MFKEPLFNRLGTVAAPAAVCCCTHNGLLVRIIFRTDYDDFLNLHNRDVLNTLNSTKTIKKILIIGSINTQQI